MDNIELGKRYDEIIDRCVSIFEAKTKDYGPTWLFFRDESFVDQLWIKARRIRTLEENGDESLVGEGRADEYLGIVNYGIIMLMRMQNPEIFPSPDTVVADTDAYHRLGIDDMKQAYLRGCIGQTYPVLFEQEKGGLYVGHAPNYCQVGVRGKDLHNIIHDVRIVEVTEDMLTGELT